MKFLVAVSAILGSWLSSPAQMVTKHLYDFATPGGGGYPNDQINDHQALVDAAAFFQARNGYGTLIFDDGEYIIGNQQLWTYGDPVPGTDWEEVNYPSGGIPGSCESMVVNQVGFTLSNCAQFTVQGGANTALKYRPCLYYGAFKKDAVTQEVVRPVGPDPAECRSCLDTLHSPDLLHAGVGVMFSFYHCDSINLFDVELNGNVGEAIYGVRSANDGTQTAYDGIYLFESSRAVVRNVNAHHFGRDGINIGSAYNSNTAQATFMDTYPGLNVTVDDLADSIVPPIQRTVLFYNQVLDSKFNWNCRNGMSWTGGSKLDVANGEFNYNGNGRFASEPSAGVDIEGGGGAMRVRYGTFDDCDFLHNGQNGIVSADGQCIGQQDFVFRNCTVKAGILGNAMWPEARDMEFYDCKIYGRVGDIFEQAENITRVPDFDLEFHRTNFYEEDSLWSYLRYSPDDTCTAGPHKLDMVGAGHANILFDSCGFFTNCHGMIRFKGRSTSDGHFPYCTSCASCGIPGNNCPLGSCDTHGQCQGLDCDTVYARYVTVKDCTFKNTGRLRCDVTTQVLAVDYTLVVGTLTIDIPDAVRGAFDASDRYATPFGTNAPSCHPTYCTADTIYTTYPEFPPCKLFYTLPVTFDYWSRCPQLADEVVIPNCPVNPTCNADRALPDSTLSSTLTSPISGTINIQGQFFVDQDITFENATVYMDPGAEIVVQPNNNLYIINSTIESCQDVMWKSITANDGAIVTVKNSFINDAERGLTALNSSILLVYNTAFRGNRVSIAVPAVQGVAFNSVSVLVDSSTFYSAGAMAQPYGGQTTALGPKGYAAIEAHNMALDLTGTGNVIHHMSNGMVLKRCNATVSDWTIHDIQPDAAYASTGNGSGIYAWGKKGAYTLKQTGFGQGANTSFANCRWGIYTEYMSVFSTDNHMLDMGTAYRIDRSGYMDVDILENTVHCNYHGMDLRFNDGAAHILVEGNDITFGDDQICTLCRGYSAIRVFEANTANLNSVIRNNILRFVPLTSSRTGVNITAANDWLVQGNTVSMASRFHSRNGILTQSCERVQVSCNNITNTDPLYAQYPNDAQAAIRNWLGADPLFSCNTMDKSTNGILFSGWASNTDVRGNEFHNHRWGLHLEGDAIIGEQERKGNLWFEDAPWDGYQAWNENPNNITFVQFKVNPANPTPGALLMPVSVEPPLDWFVGTLLVPTYNCMDDEACAGFNELCGGCSASLWQMVANGTLENGAYTPPTRWIMKGDLYKLLTEQPELLVGNTLLQEFYEEVETDVLAQLKELEMGQLALYDLDLGVTNALSQGASQMDALRAQLRTATVALGDENLTPQQRQAQVQAIMELQTNIAALLEYHGAALQLAANGRAVTADAVKATNAAIAAGELIEENHKTVNAIYLSTIAVDIDSFTTGEAEALFAVANQCPLTGGNAVFRARSLYALIDDAQEFDDPQLCLQEGLITKRVRETTPPACMVIPNPAHDQATLVLPEPLTEQTWLVLNNALGAEIMRLLIPKDQLRTAFGTQGFAPGIYHYTLMDSSGTLGNGRLAIEH